jgi:periplasmic protein TonB
MKTALNNQTEYDISLLELIFSARNKDYGAYVLRTKYNKNLAIALFITVFTFIMSLVLPSVFKTKNDVTFHPTHGKTTVDFLPTPDIEQNKNNSIPVEQIRKMDVSKIKYMVPNILKDELVKNDYFPTKDDLEDRAIDIITTDGIRTDNLPPQDILTTDDHITNVENVEPSIFTYVEEMPSFPGGTDELLTLISKNIEYPEIARRAGVEGKVILGFVVERDGSITGINVIKGIGAGCDEEAIRVLKLVGNWLPGKQNGKAVRVSMIIPFVFKLSA